MASVAKELETNFIPIVVLLIAGSKEAVKSEGLSELIKMLLAKGAKTFVCIGDYSESLHDEIDEIIYEYDDERNNGETLKIITTYHDDESVDDAVNYFVHGTEFPEVKFGGLLALVADADTEADGCLSKA